MKTCSTCTETKNIDEFNKNKSRRDGYSGICRMCMKEHRKRHYESNRNKVYLEVKARRRALAKKLVEYKSKSPCSDCSESDPIVLEFDHISDDKEYNVSEMINRGMSWDNILLEIAKCEVVCANCHRRRTHQRRINANMV